MPPQHRGPCSTGLYCTTNKSMNALPQLALTLVLTRALGKLFSYMKQPQVVGEIVAGIIMGPSVLGNIPGAANSYAAVLGLLVQLHDSPRLCETTNTQVVIQARCMAAGYTSAIWPTTVYISPQHYYDSVQTFYVIASVGLILFM